MRQIFIVLAAFLFISLPVQFSCKPSAKTTNQRLLKFNLREGNGYDYDMTWDMNQTIMGQQSTIQVSGVYSIEVTAVNGPVKTLKGTYKRFKMYMKMMGMELDIDSDKPEPTPTEEELEKNPMSVMKGLFGGIVGKSFTMKVDEEGQVLEVSGFREILEGMVDSMATDDEMKTQAMASLNDQFNEQSVKESFSQAFFIYPNKEVRVGDSWEKKYSVGGKMPATYSTRYTVKEIEGDAVTLDASTEIKPSGTETDAKMSGKQTGRIIVDSRSGLMISGEFALDMETSLQGMELVIKGAGKINGREIK